MNIAAQLNCLGYFGFGSGYASQKIEQFVPREAKGACDVCPVAAACLDKHRRRVAAVFVVACSTWDSIPANEGHERMEAMRRFGSNFRQGPYQMVAIGNTEDGIRVAHATLPANRGRMTLPWPFPVQS